MFMKAPLVLLLAAVSVASSQTDLGWTPVVTLSDNAGAIVLDVGEEEFNSLFNYCPAVRYQRNGQVHSVYIRTSEIPADFNAYSIFTYQWLSPNNKLSEDFNIYSSEGDARSREHAWTFCNYALQSDVGYPRDCGPTGYTANKWFSMPGDKFNAKDVWSGSGFEIWTAPDCPADQCPNDPEKEDPGVCGCGVQDADMDGDGIPGCEDQCPNDPEKKYPGVCGCGVRDVDMDKNGILDCEECTYDDDCPEERYCHCEGITPKKLRHRGLKFGHVDSTCFCMDHIL